MSRPATNRTMLSMPLAYPSTLDRRPRRAHRHTASYVEELWSPYPPRSSRNWQAKADAYSPCAISARNAEESFSLRRGLDSTQSFFKLSITSWSGPPEQQKATHWGRPRLASMRSSRLARIPPSEGYDVVEPALRFEAVQARQDRRGRSCFSRVHLAVEFDQHCSMEHRACLGRSQDNLKKIYGIKCPAEFTWPEECVLHVLRPGPRARVERRRAPSPRRSRRRAPQSCSPPR
jgi:hypothetical protein